MQHSHDLAFAGGRSNFTLTHEHEDGQKPHMHDVTPDGSEATNTTWLNPHTQQRWVLLTLASDRPDNWPTDEDLQGGIEGAFPKEWFDPEAEDDGHWLQSIAVMAPRVVVVDHHDSDSSVLTDDGIEVHDFSDWIVEGPGDYEIDDVVTAILKIDALPPHLRPTDLHRQLHEVLADKKREAEEAAQETRDYTVVGLHDGGDGLTRFADHADARTPAEAIAIVRQNLLGDSEDEFLVAGVFEGNHQAKDTGTYGTDAE